ncbi:MAG: hypothetical protein AB8G86_04190 [Saprospiraceae bacterium]
MKKIKFTIWCLLIFSGQQIFSQNEYNPNFGLDVYGMDIIIREKIISDKCDCCTNTNFKYNCTLFKIDIQEVFLHRDSSVFVNAKELKSVKYLIIPDTFSLDKNSLNQQLTLFAYNTCSKEILVATQLLLERPELKYNYSLFPYVSELAICPKLNLWQKILVFFNINRTKIYAKTRDNPMRYSKFVNAVEAHFNEDYD